MISLGLVKQVFRLLIIFILIYCASLHVDVVIRDGKRSYKMYFIYNLIVILSKLARTMSSIEKGDIDILTRTIMSISNAAITSYKSLKDDFTIYNCS